MTEGMHHITVMTAQCRPRTISASSPETKCFFTQILQRRRFVLSKLWALNEAPEWDTWSRPHTIRTCCSMLNMEMGDFEWEKQRNNKKIQFCLHEKKLDFVRCETFVYASLFFLILWRLLLSSLSLSRPCRSFFVKCFPLPYASFGLCFGSNIASFSAHFRMA